MHGMCCSLVFVDLSPYYHIQRRTEFSRACLDVPTRLIVLSLNALETNSVGPLKPLD